MTTENKPTAPLSAADSEAVNKQVAAWRREVARLQDLIAHATGASVIAPLSAEELDKLEALARAATPGDWTACKFGRLIGGPERHYVNGIAQAQIASFSVTFHEQAPDDEPERQQTNTEFVAAISPRIALALIAQARAAPPLSSASIESLSRASGEERGRQAPQASVEDTRDAARYRWLRDIAAIVHGDVPTVFRADYPTEPDWNRMLHGLALDSAIDSAMSATKEGK